MNPLPKDVTPSRRSSMELGWAIGDWIKVVGFILAIAALLVQLGEWRGTTKRNTDAVKALTQEIRALSLSTAVAVADHERQLTELQRRLDRLERVQ